MLKQRGWQEEVETIITDTDLLCQKNNIKEYFSDGCFLEVTDSNFLPETSYHQACDIKVIYTSLGENHNKTLVEFLKEDANLAWECLKVLSDDDPVVDDGAFIILYGARDKNLNFSCYRKDIFSSTPNWGLVMLRKWSSFIKAIVESRENSFKLKIIRSPLSLVTLPIL